MIIRFGTADFCSSDDNTLYSDKLLTSSVFFESFFALFYLNQNNVFP